jgi:hypothetical protein
VCFGCAPTVDRRHPKLLPGVNRWQGVIGGVAAALLPQWRTATAYAHFERLPNSQSKPTGTAELEAGRSGEDPDASHLR